MARRPEPLEPLSPGRYDNVGRVAEDEPDAYLTNTLENFMDKMREVYPDWDDFLSWEEFRRQEQGNGNRTV